LITWNVAEFGDHNPERLKALIATIKERSPDIVFLQEVEKQSLTLLRNPLAGMFDYRILEGEASRGLPQGGLLALIKRNWLPQGVHYEAFPSELDRGSLSFTLGSLCGIPHTFSNVHLESPELLYWRSRDYRNQQVERLKIQTEKNEGIVIAGDLNLVLGKDADQLFPKDWNDAWLSLHPDDQGLTWDPDHNDMAYWGGGFLLPGFRLDRVLYKSEHLQVIRTDRLGVGTHPPLSDHYGLLVEFDCR
jgi:endonuclease/exonuclease/phosphatase family metal-dependent hydrolase